MTPVRDNPWDEFNRLKWMAGVSAKTEKLLSTLKLQPVVPVLIIEDAEPAPCRSRRALVAGGLKAIEITHAHRCRP